VFCGISQISTNFPIPDTRQTLRLRVGRTWEAPPATVEPVEWKAFRKIVGENHPFFGEYFGDIHGDFGDIHMADDETMMKRYDKIMELCRHEAEHC
jgi:hypothetical protein